MMVDRALTKLQTEDPDLKIDRIDVVTNPLKAWHAGVRMFPALKAGDKILSGVLLSEKEIRKFIHEVKE